ncbi:MAG: CorA family divalent cation transporter [Candidatus Magasanikbacteria bacterium]|nr:CorA family divalent cation transporter [Candidatus Magasanikbacteria bacterium]
MKHIHELDYKGLLWLNVTKQTDVELKALQERFDFWDQDIAECGPQFQRPKIIKRPGYYFMSLHFPVFDRETKRLGYTEVDFFLAHNFLITVHNSKLISIEKFFEELKKSEALREQILNGTAVRLLLELLSRLLDAVFPILVHVNEDINFVDKKLFLKLPGREMAEEILRLKTNIVTFRRTMQAHKTVLERLVLFAGHELGFGNLQSSINSLREFSSEIWLMLESQKESINALHEANESLLSLRTNDVMRILTIIAVLTFPLTLLATVFAIRAPGTPLVNLAGGFWAILGMILLGAGVMIAVFKKKGWL